LDWLAREIGRWDHAIWVNVEASLWQLKRISRGVGFTHRRTKNERRVTGIGDSTQRPWKVCAQACP